MDLKMALIGLAVVNTRSVHRDVCSVLAALVIRQTRFGLSKMIHVFIRAAK